MRAVLVIARCSATNKKKGDSIRGIHQKAIFRFFYRIDGHKNILRTHEIRLEIKQPPKNQVFLAKSLFFIKLRNLRTDLVLISRKTVVSLLVLCWSSDEISSMTGWNYEFLFDFHRSSEIFGNPICAVPPA